MGEFQKTVEATQKSLNWSDLGTGTTAGIGTNGNKLKERGGIQEPKGGATGGGNLEDGKRIGGVTFRKKLYEGEGRVKGGGELEPSEGVRGHMCTFLWICSKRKSLGRAELGKVQSPKVKIHFLPLGYCIK